MSFWSELFGQKITVAKSQATKPVPQQLLVDPVDPQIAKADGETLKCGCCGRALSVKYYEAGKQVFATLETIQSHALRCQDCGFIVCGSCAMPRGGGGAVCPSCKKAGGPYFFTRDAERARKKVMDSLRSQPVFSARQTDLLVELVALVKKDNSGFANRPRIRQIGEELNHQGGMKLMREVYSKVRATETHFSQDIWDGIGEWEQ